MDGRKMPDVIHRIKSEEIKRSKVSLGIQMLIFIFFMERNKNDMIHGNKPVKTERKAIIVLTLGLPRYVNRIKNDNKNDKIVIMPNKRKCFFLRGSFIYPFFASEKRLLNVQYKTSPEGEL